MHTNNNTHCSDTHTILHVFSPNPTTRWYRGGHSYYFTIIFFKNSLKVQNNIFPEYFFSFRLVCVCPEDKGGG